MADTEYTKGFKAGSVFEQERIIKLLEERKCGCYCEVHMVLDPAIAAIKGEK